MERMGRAGVRIKLFYSSTWLAISCFIILLLSGCTSCNQQHNNNQSQTNTPSKPVIPTPSFNPDSAYLFVKTQVDFGPRVPNSNPHTKCGDYLAMKMREFCDTVIEQRSFIKA